MRGDDVEGLTVERPSRLRSREERHRHPRKATKRRAGALITLADLILIVVMALFMFYLTKNERPQQTPNFSYLLKAQEFNNLALISLAINAKNEFNETDGLDVRFFWNEDNVPFYEERVLGVQFTPSYTIYIATDTPLTSDKTEAILQIIVSGVETFTLQHTLVSATP